MSRFGLRSCSDGLKLIEEKNNCRKNVNPSSGVLKRMLNQKVNNKEENLIDDIKVETDELEKCSDTSDKLSNNKTAAKVVGNDDDNYKYNEHGNDNNDEHDFKQKSLVCKRSIVCSLPLERINEIIHRLDLNKSNIDNEKEPEEIMIDEMLDNDDDEEDDTNISKQSASNIKNLCLYCDRKFSSHKMQLKHVEKFHCLQQDRRCSGRNAQQQQQITPRKRRPATGSQGFPGCNFCQKVKGQSQVILPAADLSSLFLHLTDFHTDKYFGCKVCVVRFQNISKLSKHMEIVHKSLPFAFDESSSKSKDNDNDYLVSVEKSSIGERTKLSLKRQQRSQKSVNSCMSMIGSSLNTVTTPQCSTARAPNTSVIGAEEPILSRLGLTQNRLPNNRKGVRLRREKLLPEMLLKSDQNHTSATTFAFGPTTSISASFSTCSTCSPKLRGKSIKAIGGFSGDTASEAVFRVPTRNDILSCIFDDNFYKEVVSNVRNNLCFNLDGKIMGNSIQELDKSMMRHAHQTQIRSTLVKSPIVVTTVDSEIHAATSLSAITAFPTLLTAEQFGADTSSSKIRRPHTKNSWKWKWDNVKKFKLINEGGKIVKKIKHPMFGLRDLSKLDMWTQLTMRQKHELQQQQKVSLSVNDNQWHRATMTVDSSREEKQRINDQLNFILDMRLLPHIILEQNEQAIIKLENDEFGIAPTQIAKEDCGDNFMAQTFADESFLSMLNLLPNSDTQNTRTKLVLSGEWARPRCYLCTCCGAKFEKIKSLEEHKMFRHSQIISTHYEVVGRELLNGNLLRHLFIPKKALSRYGNESDKMIYSGAARRLFWHKTEALIREITNNDESSDSLQSVLHRCVTNSPSLKNSSSSTEDCDIDSKQSTTALQIIGHASVVSPTHSIQSCSSSSSVGIKAQLKMQTGLGTTPIGNTSVNSSSYNNNSIGVGSNCSKCARKCNGVLDLYRHMLDCSGDYIWSLAKKRKYRYYCGSKKRRPCNKHSILELRKSKTKTAVKPLSISNDNTTEESAVSSSNFTKIKISPRSRPSDAESIKKMLENLPPKRICKKIFPVLSKAKKSIKNKIKPKLLAKHKIYNSLRKTRVRQMAHAAKILSKTKSQLKKPKKMATRSFTSTLSRKAVKSRSNKNKKRVKLEINKNCEKKRANNSISNEDNISSNKPADQTDCYSIKTEKKTTKAILVNDMIAPDKPTEVEEYDPISKNSCDLLITNKPKDYFENLSYGEKLINATTKQTNEKISNVDYSALQKDVPGEDQSKEKLNDTTTAIRVTFPSTERNAQTNTKIVKRSKRISDCIAMLTGKLEEKLKTEQKKVVPPISEELSVMSQPIKTLVSPLPTKPMQQQPMLVFSKPAEEMEINKISPKKIPKRKAISRRIMKTNLNEDTSLPISTKNMENKANVNSEFINPVEIVLPPGEVLLPNQSIAHQMLRNQRCTATTTSVKKYADLVISQRENKRPIDIIPTNVTSMPPPVAPPNAPVLLAKMPLFLPLDNVREPVTAPHIKPMTLPVPVPVPTSIENVSQSFSVSISTTIPNIIPRPVIPINTAVPTHIPPHPVLQLTVSSFNASNAEAEPLNLSNSMKNVPKQSQDLTCASIPRMSEMKRRQTICGFEARNFAVFDEMEPLDLSKKSRPEKTAVSPLPPKHIEMSSLLLPLPQPSVGIPNEPSVLTIQSTASEALLNPPFYSNLDLLRIPQVRNPVGCQGVVCTNESLQPAVLVTSTPAIVQQSKPAKKRNKPLVLQTTINTNTPMAIKINELSLTAKTNNTKDMINNSKKETSTRNKTVLRMDEEVINHIDDAINSVINAVKASLDCEEALKTPEVISIRNQPPPESSMKLKTTVDVNAAQDAVTEFKYLTAARRNMRSKTLDSRPSMLNKTCMKNPCSSINQQQNDTGLVTVTSVHSNTTASVITVIADKSIINQNIEMIKYLDNKTNIQECNSSKPLISEGLKNQLEKKRETNTKNETQINFLELGSNVPEKYSAENFTKQNQTIIQESSVEKQLTGIVMDNLEKHEVTKAPKSFIETVEVPAIPAVNQVKDVEAKNFVNSVTTNSINLELDHVSNNNNTSSGFHSSADQQTSIMSTTTSAASMPIGAGCNTKKKQRRRRKNELAAIVADQLLESFKLDKARRDNLKKLENLAYEKSEDLLLTGMLLMSSTKRNVTSTSSSNINAQVQNSESAVSLKRVVKSQRSNQSNEVQKQIDVNTIQTKNVTESAIEKSVEKDGNPSELGESGDGKKNSKRRQYRRRGKILDNENISKLKSSLESFSIDIERQLTEYEAKNLNVFKNVQGNENSKQSCNSKNHTSNNGNKASIVLRPSILSLNINQEILQITTKALTNDSNKTVVASRDPRLNKNIHKEGEKIIESLGTGNAKESVLTAKNKSDPAEIGDLEEDNYLTEIAKNVNEKIMSTENEEFAFKDDGFEMVNDMAMDDSNSKFSRPPTSMSVRSAPNFNDDHSNFGSICDENTNTEVMDMDLDDEMSVYTSYSQDLGSGRGRRRRRRRSILLTRKPKKRASSRDMSAEKIECILCKKVFYSANSLSKHNMTLAHVSKVSEQEYLLSKMHSNIPNLTNSQELQTYGTLGPYARRSTRRSTISEPPMHSRCTTNPSPPLLATQSSAVQFCTTTQSSQNGATFKVVTNITSATHSASDLKRNELIDNPKSNKFLLNPPPTKEQISVNEYDLNTTANASYNGNSRLNLNPDERLFFECCNILKSAETPRLNNLKNSAEECNINANFSYSYNHQEKSTISTTDVNRPPANNLIVEPASINGNTNNNQLNSVLLTNSNLHEINQQPPMEQETLFRDPYVINQSSYYTKASIRDNRNPRSPTYSAISHLSAVTNTTSRFKTKAAMKGYEDLNIDLHQQQESKSRTICKLTELAEIALGNEAKPNSHDFSPIRTNVARSQITSDIIHLHQNSKINIDNGMIPKRLDTPEHVTTVSENIREGNVKLASRGEGTKNNETQSSTSSKTIMHSSIIKAAVEEHQKARTSNKIIIPDRPFKNIGLEEKETITFQKPKVPAVNLLTEDNNSVSTGSFSDRDDYDFGSLSCDDEVSVRESSDKNQKNNTTESSSESSRATAKTFENKSLIMGRIFKNASTKAAIKANAVNTVKVKSVGVQKDQTPVPKADLNQLFDELRGNSGVDVVVNERICSSNVVENNPVAGMLITGNSRTNHKQREALKSFIPTSPPAVVTSTTAKLPTNVRKTKTRVPRAKSKAEPKTKDISKLQTELGMSPDEIKKLIDDGQRKSKRRCATNRPKKLVEMWSSDEYEEFLSTKDIIALIEEKEQQEKRKKRKGSINISSNTNAAVKDKETSDVTSSTRDLKLRNTRRMSIAAEKNRIVDPNELLPPKNVKTKRNKNKKVESVSTTAIITKASKSAELTKDEPEKGRGKRGKTVEAIDNSSKRTVSDNTNRNRTNSRSKANMSKTKPTQKVKQVPAAKESPRTTYKKRQYEDFEESNDDISEDDDDDDDDFLISELKIKQTKARRGKGTNCRSVADVAKAIVTSTSNVKSSKHSGIAQEMPTKKMGSNNNTICYNTNNAGSSSNSKNQTHNQLSAKIKKKNVSNQSPPRRKRLATEKLYYWSSSSDEDFGRINNNKSSPLPDNYESVGEQYQKHGWIVGDSHKKLVTLLAIAKGNKKVDSSSGVKKNIGKKRN